MMNSLDRRLAQLNLTALLCVAMLLATTVLSAFMRLSQAGLGCDDWPVCYGQHLRDLQQGIDAQATGSGAVSAARVAHRLVASVALLLVIRLVWATLVVKPVLRRQGALALLLLMLALALALLGVVTPGARAPAVAMGNLLGGFLMLALCWRLVQSRTEPAGPRLGGLGLLGVAVLSVHVVTGALTSTTFAGLSCGDLAECYRASQAAGWEWQALNPLREPVFDATATPVNPAGALVQLLHRLGAFVVLPVLGVLGVIAWRRGLRRGAAVLLVLTAVQPVLGLLMVTAGLPLAPALLHNLVAALLVATLVRLV